MPPSAPGQPAPPPLPAVVKSFSAASLANDFASEMVYPLLPAFLSRTLGAGPVAVGALDGIAELVASVVKWASGRLADRPGWRGPLVVGGYGLATVVRPLMAAAGSAGQVLGLRAADRVGKGLRTPARDAVDRQGGEAWAPGAHATSNGYRRSPSGRTNRWWVRLSSASVARDSGQSRA